MYILQVILQALLSYGILLNTVNSQCTGLEAGNVASKGTPSTHGLLPDSFLQATDGQPTLPLTVLHSYNIVCLSVGFRQGTYRSASIVANFTCSGHMNCTGDPQQIQFEVECLILDGFPTWSSNLTFLADSRYSLDFKDNGHTMPEVRTDCAFCITPSIFPIADNIYHCISCSSQCIGLRQCQSSDPGSCCNVYQNGSCRVGCDNGYTPDGANECVVVVCPELTVPENGQVNTTGLSFNSEAVYSCNTRFNISGDTTRVCESSGQWSGASPTCTEITCGNLTKPENGRLSLTDGLLFGSKAAYSCFDGYILNGTNVRLCTASGTWEEADPTCTAIIRPTRPTSTETRVDSGTITWTVTVAATFVLVFVLFISTLAGYGIYRMKRNRRQIKMEQKPVEPLVTIMTNTR